MLAFDLNIIACTLTGGTIYMVSITTLYFTYDSGPSTNNWNRYRCQKILKPIFSFLSNEKRQPNGNSPFYFRRTY